jgi:hypothetical protein
MKSNVLELRNLIQGFRLSCQTEGKSPQNHRVVHMLSGQVLHLFGTK